MPDEELDEAIRAARAALGPAHDGPLPPAAFGLQSGDDPETTAAFARAPEGVEPVVEPPPPVSGVPVWDAVRALKYLLDLIPPSSDGRTRLDQCVTLIRAYAETDLFPDAVPDRPSGDTLVPISYPRAEMNHAVAASKTAILGLLDSVDIEKAVRERLRRELQTRSEFLEPDDRGTIGGIIEPSGPTTEKPRNNARLDALAVFLDALRKEPFAVVRYAARLLSAVTIPPGLLSVDLSANKVTFRGTAYPASEPTCHFIAMLLAAAGNIVSTGDLKKELKARGLWEDGQLRPDRLRKGLPPELQRAIATDRRGSRLDVDRLLSHV